MRRIAVLCAIVLVGLLCFGGVEASGGSRMGHRSSSRAHQRLFVGSRVSKEDDIREAVFRYQFAHNCWGHTEKVYFLSLTGRKDPSPRFMKRFSRSSPPVKPVSRSKIDSNLVPGRPRTAVIDKDTGDCGLIFSVDKIKWISKSEVEVTGGYYADGLAASGNTYRVVFEKGRWTVTKDTLNWIS